VHDFAVPCSCPHVAEAGEEWQLDDVICLVTSDKSNCRACETRPVKLTTCWIATALQPVPSPSSLPPRASRAPSSTGTLSSLPPIGGAPPPSIWSGLGCVEVEVVTFGISPDMTRASGRTRQCIHQPQAYGAQVRGRIRRPRFGWRSLMKSTNEQRTPSSGWLLCSKNSVQWRARTLSRPSRASPGLDKIVRSHNGQD